MSLIIFTHNHKAVWRFITFRHISSFPVVQNTDNIQQDYTAVPQYPKIQETSHEAVKERLNDTWYESIKSVKTVEEKQIKLNMPKYYGFKSYVLNEDKIPYNSLPLTQHLTRTHLIECEKLPDFYNQINVDKIVDVLKSLIEEVVLMNLDFRKINGVKVNQINEIDSNVNATINQINRVIVNNLQSWCKHLCQAAIDYEPRIEAHWVVGGMDPEERHRKMLEACVFTKSRANDPVDRHFHYYGKPVLSIRHDLPLKPIIPLCEASNPDFSVPFFKYDPRTIGTFIEHLHAANIPGFWADEKKQFGLMSYHRNYLSRETFRESLNRQAILASFAWLHAQANTLGFTTFNEITYPLVTQTVITNGKVWSFFVYQLNTLLIHGKHIFKNPNRNICWALPEMHLYDEIIDGKLINFNDNVLKTLIKFYLNTPEERLGINLRPYLTDDEKIISDYSDDDKRQWLQREFKYLSSNRPRFKLPFELYHWEKIYKVDHKTRPRDKKLRPFELNINPFNRKLNERQPIYIPRCLRPHLPRNKGRYQKEYFPD